MSQKENSTPEAVISTQPLEYAWPTPDPFIFCVHHDDRYPAGNEQLGPAASLSGRDLGQDFASKDGWNMYHGQVVPGFPQHPHRGFETITIVRSGLLDHADSVGAAARYGGGDVQWLTAGRGIQHSEMFPLLNRSNVNPLEFFQIWINLPREDKFAQPHFSMLWRDTVPKHVVRDEAGRTIEVTIIAGRLGELSPPPPPPKSWAARSDTQVAVWTIKLSPNARWTLPAAPPGVNRSLYFFRGTELRVGGRAIVPARAIELRAEADVPLEGGPDEVELLLLQGRPIREPIARHGPFVMNSREEIYQAYAEYQRTQFGGWPWPRHDPVHSREEGRFARRPDGSIERPA
jgi:redox-sensitive bicupin YhaK (pirin superfamily)